MPPKKSYTSSSERMIHKVAVFHDLFDSLELKVRTAVAMSFSDTVSAEPREISASASCCCRTSGSAPFSSHSLLIKASRRRDSASYVRKLIVQSEVQTSHAHRFLNSVDIASQLVMCCFVLIGLRFKGVNMYMALLQLPFLYGQQLYQVARSSRSVGSETGFR